MNNDTTPYVKKYSYFLKYLCYGCNNDFPTQLSINKNGLCNSEICYSCNLLKGKDNIYDDLTKIFFDKKISIVDKIKELLNKCEKTSGKENKARICLDIYKMIYYNIYFSIIHPKFLITFINKIIDFLEKDYDIFIKIQNENEQYKDAFTFMIWIRDYIKNNNINLNDVSKTQESQDTFLETFVKYMEIFYNDEIDNNNKIEKSKNIIYDNDNDIDIDIDNINLVSLILDI